MSAKGGSDPCSGSRARSATTAELSGGATGASNERERLLDLEASIALSLASPRLADAGRALFAALGRLPQGLAETDAEALFGEDAFEAVRGLLAVGRASRRRRVAP